MLKRLLSCDTIGTGLILGLGSTLATALLLTLGLLVFGLPPAEHLRWYATCFVPPILLLRLSVKQQHTTTTKTLMTTLFLSFIPFIILLFRTHSLQMQ